MYYTANGILCLVASFSIIEGGVLDPALYLSPSPPLTTIHNNNAEILWSQPPRSTIAIENTPKEDIQTEKTESPESMDSAETFWPSFRPYSVRGIHIPLTFHLSGTYGGKSGSGVVSSGYIDISDNYDSSDKAVLAGSGYKSHGSRPSVRIFSSDTKPAWGGWGNGKWGHYGKG